MGIFNRRNAPAANRVRIRRPLTASATSVSRAEGTTLRRLNQPWQARALAYYENTGECWYPTQFYARSMPRIRFYPAILDERGDPQEIEDGPLVDLWERVQDPSGGRTQLTTSYGQLMFVIGDGYLTITEDDEREAWEFLSPLELRTVPGASVGDRAEYRRMRAPGLTPEELVEAPDDDFEPVGNETRVYRLYRRHPSYSDWADSPIRAVLELYELLHLLTLAAGAEAQSRAAQRGMFYMPDEVTLGGLDAEMGTEDPQADPLYQELIEALNANIRDPGTAGAMAPFWLRGPATFMQGQTPIPMKDLMGWLPLGPDKDSYGAIDKWDKVIQRIAYGLDMPAEMLTGTGEVNHWGGWLLDEQGFRQHVAPLVQAFCADMTSAYLRPAARDAGVGEWERVTLWYDPAGAVNHPDETEVARNLFLDGAGSAEFYRDKAGATEDDAATDDDRAWILALKGKQAAEVVEEEDGETAPQDGGTGNDTDEEAPETEPSNGNGGGGRAASAALAFRVLGASDLAVIRARSLAGSRLRSRAKGCEPCLDAIADVPAHRTASALGHETVSGIITGRATEAQLVAGAADELGATIIPWGVSREWAEQIGERVEQHALRTLYEVDPPPLPAGFAAIVKRAVAA